MSSVEMPVFTFEDRVEVPKPALAATVSLLQSAREVNYEAFRVFVQICKNAKYSLGSNAAGNSREFLLQWKMIDEHSNVHDLVRVITSRVTKGEGLKIQVVDPLKPLTSKL